MIVIVHCSNKLDVQMLYGGYLPHLIEKCYICNINQNPNLLRLVQD